MSVTNEQLTVSKIPITMTSPRGTGFDSAIVCTNSVDCERSNSRGFSETLIRMELLCDTGFDSPVDHLHSVNSKRLNYLCPEVHEREPLNLGNFFEMEPIDNNNTKRIFTDKQLYTNSDAPEFLNLSNFFEMEPIDNNNTKRIFTDKQLHTNSVRQSS